MWAFAEGSSFGDDATFFVLDECALWGGLGSAGFGSDDEVGVCDDGFATW